MGEDDSFWVCVLGVDMVLVFEGAGGTVLELEGEDD